VRKRKDSTSSPERGIASPRAVEEKRKGRDILVRECERKGKTAFTTPHKGAAYATDLARKKI